MTIVFDFQPDGCQTKQEADDEAEWVKQCNRSLAWSRATCDASRRE